LPVKSSFTSSTPFATRTGPVKTLERLPAGSVNENVSVLRGPDGDVETGCGEGRRKVPGARGCAFEIQHADLGGDPHAAAHRVVRREWISGKRDRRLERGGAGRVDHGIEANARGSFAEMHRLLGEDFVPGFEADARISFALAPDGECYRDRCSR